MYQFLSWMDVLINARICSNRRRHRLYSLDFYVTYIINNNIDLNNFTVTFPLPNLALIAKKAFVRSRPLSSTLICVGPHGGNDFTSFSVSRPVYLICIL